MAQVRPNLQFTAVHWDSLLLELLGILNIKVENKKISWTEGGMTFYQQQAQVTKDLNYVNLSESHNISSV